MKPIIGIVEWPYLDKDGDTIYEVMLPIIEWVIRSGGRPIGIFPSNIDDFINKKVKDISLLSEIEQKELNESLSMCDAIIKPGALKIYGHERLIYKYCHDNNVPYLGICAGMQIMASYNKDKITNEKNDSYIKHSSKELYAHKVLLKKLSLLGKMLNKDEIMVNSHHNYHIKDSGVQKISGYAPDGIIEAIESDNCDFHIGLQWHPELAPKEDEVSQIIFGELVENAKKYKLTK